MKKNNKTFIFTVLGILTLVVTLVMILKPAPAGLSIEIRRTRHEEIISEISKPEIEVKDEPLTFEIIETLEPLEPFLSEPLEPLEQKEYIGRQPPPGYMEPIPNEHLTQHVHRDTYQSNIVIILEELRNLLFNDKKWFDFDGASNAHIAQYIIYAILTYYDGDVPCNYYTDLFYHEDGYKDIHSPQNGTTMQFEVQTHGDKPLNICLDMSNIQIRVEEGIKQRNPDCKLGCCE